MARYQDGSGDQVEWLDLDYPDGVARPERAPWPGWAKLVLLLVSLAVIAGAIGTQRGRQSASRVAPGPVQPPAPTVASTPSEPPLGVWVTAVGHPLLGVTDGWELYGRGPGVLVRIQPARGLITRTTVPGLLSSGPVSFVVAGHRAIIRPIDRVFGYLVSDGQSPDPIALAPGSGGPAFPSPSPDLVWMQTGGDVHPWFGLTAADWKQTAVIPVPAGSSPLEASADGAGYLLFSRPDGVYQARPGVFHRLTTGTVLAVGPAGWVDAHCDSHHHCTLSLISRTTGSRRALGSETGGLPGGVISPDGSTAAMLEISTGGAIGLSLLDLHSGSRRSVAVAMDGDGTVIFSPDSHWLFAVTARGSLAVIDVRTADVGGLGAPLPPLSQLAVKPGSR